MFADYLVILETTYDPTCYRCQVRVFLLTPVDYVRDRKDNLFGHEQTDNTVKKMENAIIELSCE